MKESKYITVLDVILFLRELLLEGIFKPFLYPLYHRTLLFLMLPVLSPVDALLGNAHVITKLTLSPDVLFSNKDRSFVGGIYADCKDEFKKVPKNLTNKDLEDIKLFFKIFYVHHMCNFFVLILNFLRFKVDIVFYYIQ